MRATLFQVAYHAGGIASHGATVESYHESHARLRAPGDHRKPLDESKAPDLRSRSSREAAARR